MNKEPAGEKRAPARAHNVTMENRGAARLTGVVDVASFNEQEIVMSTDQGEIALLGEGLHISQLNLEEGKVTVEGVNIQKKHQKARVWRRALVQERRPAGPDVPLSARASASVRGGGWRGRGIRACL